MKTLISSLVLVVAAVGAAHAQIYKWVDEVGKTHYSDTAPTRAKKLDLAMISRGGTRCTSALMVVTTKAAPAV